MSLRRPKPFSNMTMGFKITATFLAVMLAPMATLAYVSYRVIDARLVREANEKVTTGLKAAWTEYYIRGAQMRYGSLQVASMDEIRRAFERSDRAYLKDMLSRWRQVRPYVDIWILVDGGGRAIVRLNSDFAGDAVDLNGMVAASLGNRETVVSTELLDAGFLRIEGGGLTERLAPPGAAHDPGAGAMALMAVTPVEGAGSRVAGAIIMGDVLNGDDHIPATVARKMPGLFTTVASGAERISTDLVDGRGYGLTGTRLPDEAHLVLKSGRQFTGEWSMPGAAYLSAAEPIRDWKGAVIGSLDVAASKEELWAIQRESQTAIALVALAGFVFSLVLAVVSTGRITGPLKALKEKLAAYAAGDRGARVEISAPPDARDEIAALARAFNSMMDDVGRRDVEKERYLKEIEEKNTESLIANEALKKTNEELEVAYEETQSQTEELHAINEELKLLNEDLDRKNAELKKANSVITREEEEIKRAKDKLRLIYDSIRDYVLLVDYDYNIVEANTQFLERFRLTEPELRGRKIYSLLGMDAVGRNCPIKRAIETRKAADAEMQTADGRVLTCHAFPFIADGEEPAKAVVYVRDVTEQRLLMQRLVQSDKLSSLGELVSGVAHELNNPLTGIMCFSELIMEDDVSEEVRGKVRKISEASQRCRKIIENLLTFARWKRPERRYEDLNRVIRDAFDLRAYQMRVDDIKAELDLAEDLNLTMLDADQMQQVFLNLVNNAMDAVREKGGKGGTIRISTRNSDGAVVARVEDNGKGMAHDVLGRIFDPFFTTKDVGKGTGLGLSISYGIVTEHGGNIHASSMPGQGSVFVIELPVMKDETRGGGEAAAASPPQAARDATKGYKALVLDDEEIILEMLTDALGHLGFVVDRAASGAEAARLLCGGHYDVIISDIKMPGQDGRDFYRRLTEIDPGASERVIFMTGDSMNAETREFLRQTGRPCIKKPFTIVELNAAVSNVLK
jgi:PAS domain S-box-containing protein